MIKIELIFLLMGFLISRTSGKHHKWDCICGELAGIGFLIIISFLLNRDYGAVCLEPMKVARLLILGYLPGRVIEWWWRE